MSVLNITTEDSREITVVFTCYHLKFRVSMRNVFIFHLTGEAVVVMAVERNPLKI